MRSLCNALPQLPGWLSVVPPGGWMARYGEVRSRISLPAGRLRETLCLIGLVQADQFKGQGPVR